MRKYIIIAGVNGVGKSTLYQSSREMHGMERINTDEIVREIGAWNNFNDVMTAGKIAVEKIQYNFLNGISFNQETTLCGQMILNNICKAKELGYTIEMHYISVESVNIAKERVHMRVQLGGHGIPDSDIERRYIESFVQLNKIIQNIDLLALYDNTIAFRRFAIYRNGNIVKISHNCPKWFYDHLI